MCGAVGVVRYVMRCGLCNERCEPRVCGCLCSAESAHVWRKSSANTRRSHAPANMESMLKSSLAEARPPLLLMALDSASANCRQREPTETPISTQWRKKPKLQCSPNLHGHLPPTLLVLQRKKRKITEVAAQT